MSKRLECMDEWMDSIHSSIHWIPLWNVMTSRAPAALIAILLQKVSYFPSNEYFSPLQTYPICNTCPGTLIMILLLSSKLLAWDLSRDPLMGQRPLKWTPNDPPNCPWLIWVWGQVERNLDLHYLTFFSSWFDEGSHKGPSAKVRPRQWPCQCLFAHSLSFLVKCLFVTRSFGMIAKHAEFGKSQGQNVAKKTQQTPTFLVS